MNVAATIRYQHSAYQRLPVRLRKYAAELVTLASEVIVSNASRLPLVLDSSRCSVGQPRCRAVLMARGGPNDG
jgi:hypothetical protein